MIESPLAHLTTEQIDDLGKQFDAIHDEVFDELGDRDRRYITSMIEMHRRLVVLSRLLLLGSRAKPAWIAGTSMLSLATSTSRPSRMARRPSSSYAASSRAWHARAASRSQRTTSSSPC